MSPYLFLLPAGVVLALGGYLSYTPEAKNHRSFIYVMAAIGALNVSLWALAAKVSETPKQLFCVGLAWDLLTLFSYTVIPLLLFSIKLSTQAWLGLILAVVGVLLVKLG